MLKRRAIFSEKKKFKWWKFGFLTAITNIPSEIILFVQGDKLFSSIHNKWIEDTCFYNLLCLNKTLHSVSQKMEQLTEDLVCISVLQIL